ncbi:TPA: hypothetical protein N0F65_005455 [Lagenidium giganteum]|uniref:Endoplasmic reticulum-Golgi intermediate compartment protein 3 n=1 Tax=Lagenidium giganteum TaxID=4803 RepID=A0AAV2YX88_9STRA|nr:TPA: hypothetical protein N0F65_005455 [Lagenidium giganteum]
MRVPGGTVGAGIKAPHGVATMAATAGNWLTKLKSIDAYPKTIEEFKVRTMQGGVYSLLAFVFIIFLLVSEMSYYFSMDTVDKMMVDGTRNRIVQIHFDVEFPKMPCAIIAVESSDLSGKVHHDIVHNIKKVSIDANGAVINEGKLHSIGGAMTNHTDIHSTEETPKPDCGSCYAAGAPGECCNTCDEVKAVYARKNWAMPSLHTVAQCQEEEIEKVLRGGVNEGCRIQGIVEVSKVRLDVLDFSSHAPRLQYSDLEMCSYKVAGKFYFAPSKFFRNGYLSAQDLLDTTFKVFDTSHKIHTIAFGDVFPEMTNPLDNRKKSLDTDTRGTYQYFLKVVPTEYQFLAGQRIETNQFSVTEHFRALTPVSEKGLPMISFSYTFSPIMFRIEQTRKGLLQFLTSVCAIVGGVFTLMGLMDSATFALLSKSARAPVL